MGATFRLKVVTPNGAAYDEEVSSLTANTTAGEITVLSEHCLLLSALEAGRMIAVTKNDQKQIFALDTGFLEAGPNHVNIISENCAQAADLDADKLNGEVKEIQAKIDAADPAAPERSTLEARRAWIDACLSVVAGK